MKSERDIVKEFRRHGRRRTSRGLHNTHLPALHLHGPNERKPYARD